MENSVKLAINIKVFSVVTLFAMSYILRTKKDWLFGQSGVLVK